MKINEILQEAVNRDHDTLSKVLSQLGQIYHTIADGKTTDFEGMYAKAKQLVKITGRGAKAYSEDPLYGGYRTISAGRLFDQIEMLIQDRQLKSGQAVPFPKGNSTARSFVNSLEKYFKGYNATYRSFYGRKWTMGGGGGTYRDPQFGLEFDNEENRDSAWEEIQKHGKKVYIKGPFRSDEPRLHIQIGKFVLTPGTRVGNAFGDNPTSEYFIYVQSIGITRNPLTPKVDITDQQAEALRDIAATRNANAIEGIKAIMAILKGEEDVKNIIANSKKIDPKDKAKLDTIIAGAKNFREPT